MFTSDGGPQTVADLLRNVPPSNRPGVFPTQYLGAGERILFETRPSFLRLYWGRLTVYILLFLIFLGPVEEPSYVSNPAFPFFESLLVVLILLTWLAWRRTAYALTDRQILATSGIFGGSSVQAPYDQIQNLTVGVGETADIVFNTSEHRGISIGVRGGRKIVWKSVPYATRVYQFVQLAFGIRARVIQQEQLRNTLVAKTFGGTITCTFCGNPISVQGIDPTKAKCPNCGAPVMASLSGR